MQSVAVGSLNPVKIGAVQAAVSPVWAGVTVSGVAVPSGVSAMPLSDRECIDGARNRAQAALRVGQADLGVGLEGGIEEMAEGMMLVGWVACAMANGRSSLASTGRLLLPHTVAEQVRAGEELGDVIDRLTAQENTKQKGGAIGIFTQGYASRQEAFRLAVVYALAPLIGPYY